ncbi:hypothetical protein HPP92_004815 [Vanilla planifolia]|uniref:Glucan endo-1,3-beta-D-glucosidase n=1 Tax=Vanilla planifolia TaxID=51239 RepID=A0A835RKI9_VANPL|nr:hypothetical protein HPP92_004815 [Vanilla planifolia]
MAPRETLFRLICCTVYIVSSASVNSNIGVNWGSQASNPLNPDIVLRMLKDNGISKLKLFDADQWTLDTFSATGIEIMVGIPNDQLSSISKNYGHAKDWVKENVTKYAREGGIKMK